jgi:hypothetical protein
MKLMIFDELGDHREASQEELNRIALEKAPLAKRMSIAMGRQPFVYDSGRNISICYWCDGIYPNHKETCARQHLLADIAALTESYADEKPQ